MMDHPALVFLAGLLAGAMNAAAGGGSFVTLPALMFAGVPSLAANQSSTVALMPGSLASVYAYRDDFAPFAGVSTRAMLATSLVGGGLGAALLLATPARAFDAAVPWLMLAGALTFAFGPRAGAALRRRLAVGPRVLLGVQLLLAVYGGYFGGAVGIMMLAAWSLLGPSDLRSMNAAKTLLVTATNAVAVCCFVAVGRVQWPETLTMLAAAVIGGYASARWVRRLPAATVRAGIIALNCVMTLAVFARAFR